MNRCPNPQCLRQANSGQCFCGHCGIAIKHCGACQSVGKYTTNRANGFYCRRCGSHLPDSSRRTVTPVNLLKTRQQAQLRRLYLAERSDSFALASSQALLWLLTSSNNLRIIENTAPRLRDLALEHNFSEQFLAQIHQIQPVAAPLVCQDRVWILGRQQALSFSIHPHPQRWLRQTITLAWPTGWQPIFNAEIRVTNQALTIPLHHDDGRNLLFSLTPDHWQSTQINSPDPSLATSTSVLTLDQELSQIADLLIAPLDPSGQYYWAKTKDKTEGRIYYYYQQQLRLLAACPALLFFTRPVMVGQRLYALTTDYRLMEFTLQQGQITEQRKLHQIAHGARLLAVAHGKLAIALQESILIIDTQTGELQGVATDIDATHIFSDIVGNLLVIHRNGQVVIINGHEPLERWFIDDATTDDSRIYDAFIAQNSLYTLSENGEVCRLDFLTAP
jgi:hypothetical protein